MSLQAKIQDVFDEPACDKNKAKDEKARKKGCSKPLTPGAAAGGCAFDGAKIVLQPITDAAHLVHGPLACEGNSYDNRHAASSGPLLYRTSFTTDVSELDVVMGRGEKKLYRAIREIVETHAPPAIFVYSTCVTALIGDDLAAVCKAASAAFATPVVPVNAPGFAGAKQLGNKLAGETLFDHVIGTGEPDDAGPTDINIIGEYNLSGELWQVKPLFDRLGIRLRACITGDARFADVAAAHTARANMMVCSAALINLARKMEERWQIPWFEGSFYGVEDTSDALRQTARLLVRRGADADLLARTEALIAEEEARVRTRLQPYRPLLEGRRVLLYTGGVKSWSVVSALMEMGMEIVGTSVRKSTPEDKARIKALMKDDPHMFEAIAPRDMYRMLKDGEADIMLSGGRTQFIALKAKTPWMDINQERHDAFAGYDGMVAMIAKIADAIHNPVWAAVRAPAPWEAAGDPDVAPAGPNWQAEALVSPAHAGPVLAAEPDPAPGADGEEPPTPFHLKAFRGTDAQDLGEC